MTAQDIYEVVKKLTGPIEPIADSVIDMEIGENLKVFIEVFDKMHTDIDDIARLYSESPYGSQKHLGQICSKHLDNMGIKNCTC